MTTTRSTASKSSKGKGRGGEASPGPDHPDWPYVGLDGPVSTMGVRLYRRWRARSEALRREHAARLGRALVGRELIALCDRPACAEVLGVRLRKGAGRAERRTRQRA